MIVPTITLFGEAVTKNIKKKLKVGNKLGLHFKNIVKKELQTLDIGEIREALINENKSEKCELF